MQRSPGLQRGVARGLWVRWFGISPPLFSVRGRFSFYTCSTDPHFPALSWLVKAVALPHPPWHCCLCHNSQALCPWAGNCPLLLPGSSRHFIPSSFLRGWYHISRVGRQERTACPAPKGWALVTVQRGGDNYCYAGSRDRRPAMHTHMWQTPYLYIRL